MPESKSNLSKLELNDPLTGESFVQKRPNQLFASRENQIKFNNLKAKKIREKTSFVNKPLLQNFRILEELLKNKKEITVHEQFLLGRGFAFDVYTGAEKHENVNRFVIFHYFFIPIENYLIKIIKDDSIKQSSAF